MGFDGNPNAQSSCNKFRHIIINKIKLKKEEVNFERERVKVKLQGGEKWWWEEVRVGGGIMLGPG